MEQLYQLCDTAMSITHEFYAGMHTFKFVTVGATETFTESGADMNETSTRLCRRIAPYVAQQRAKAVNIRRKLVALDRHAGGALDFHVENQLCYDMTPKQHRATGVLYVGEREFRHDFPHLDQIAMREHLYCMAHDALLASENVPPPLRLMQCD